MLPTYQCKRCGHEWVPRVEIPGSCPKCHNTRWATERNRGSYGFDDLNIGDEVLIPWQIGKDGLPDQRKSRLMNSALSQFSFRTGRRFFKSGEIKGLRIKRIS